MTNWFLTEKKSLLQSFVRSFVVGVVVVVVVVVGVVVGVGIGVGVGGDPGYLSTKLISDQLKVIIQKKLWTRPRKGSQLNCQIGINFP